MTPFPSPPLPIPGDRSRPRPLRKKKIVFLQGACSELSGTTFDELKANLRASYGYTDADFLNYSYQGGRVDSTSGAWIPNPYGRSDPIGQHLGTSLVALHDQMLIPYHNHPNNQNTTFVLVGHSLGGSVAEMELVANVTSPSYQPGLLSEIITIDSPLRGISPSQASIGASVSASLPSLSCLLSGSAVGDLAAIYGNPAVTPLVNQSVQTAKANGVTVVTTGNQFDCLWNWVYCGVNLPGDELTQLILDPAGAVEIFSIYPPDCLTIFTLGFPAALSLMVDCFNRTHGAALSDSNATQRIADRIGRQTP